jgi:hypothetical protein
MLSVSLLPPLKEDQPTSECLDKFIRWVVKFCIYLFAFYIICTVFCQIFLLSASEPYPSGITEFSELLGNFENFVFIPRSHTFYNSLEIFPIDSQAGSIVAASSLYVFAMKGGPWFKIFGLANANTDQTVCYARTGIFSFGHEIDGFACPGDFVLQEDQWVLKMLRQKLGLSKEIAEATLRTSDDSFVLTDHGQTLQFNNEAGVTVAQAMMTENGKWTVRLLEIEQDLKPTMLVTVGIKILNSNCNF